jgi:c-di-GMP-binding flagellar brake protein YcgR
VCVGGACAGQVLVIKGNAMSEELQASKQTELSDLPSAKIGIGDSLQLQDFSSTKQRYYVKLIGYLNKRSVLVSHPIQDEKLVFVKEGESFIVRGFSRIKTYEFSANVISVCLAPYPYLHLSFPAQIETMHMRSTLRIRLKLVCSIESSSLALKVPATIEDMSISGARIQAKREFGHVDEEVNVSFRLPVDGENQTFVVPAVIRNVRNETDSTTGESFVIHGLEFFQPEGMERMALQNFIYKTMAEG